MVAGDIMNERIRKLWSQVCKEEMPELDETCMTLQRQRKFAELIVQACIAQAKTDLMQWIQAQAYSGSSHTTHDMGFEKSPDWVSMDEMREYMPSAIDRIKEHFGVE